jgi:hypothetical protein
LGSQARLTELRAGRERGKSIVVAAVVVPAIALQRDAIGRR